MHSLSSKELRDYHVNEFLRDAGIYECINNDKNKIKLTPTKYSQFIPMFGDALTEEYIHNFKKWIQEKKCSPQTMAYASTICDAMIQIQPMMGDWHYSMHMLSIIFKYFYGAFIQPIATLLGWTRIQNNKYIMKTSFGPQMGVISAK